MQEIFKGTITQKIRIVIIWAVGRNELSHVGYE